VLLAFTRYPVSCRTTANTARRRGHVNFVGPSLAGFEAVVREVRVSGQAVEAVPRGRTVFGLGDDSVRGRAVKSAKHCGGSPETRGRGQADHGYDSDTMATMATRRPTSDTDEAVVSDR